MTKTKRTLLYALLLVGIADATVSVAQTPPVAKLPTRWTKTAMESALPFPEYPRPQLQRDNWLCLNGKWDYIGGKQVLSSLNPAKPISFNGKSEKILVPYCPESVISGIQRDLEINMWYQRTFEIPSSWNSKDVVLHFDAVDHDATIFVNGQKAGSHAGGYDAFSLNITAFLKKGANTLTVAAHDPNDGRTPSGKNGPRGDYTFTSGIWQT
ncbi:MAG: glycoside hydrolase family 2, partial [Pedobacter sp.]